MASPTRWAWVWVNSRSWWWTERPGMLQFMGSKRVGHNWVTELNWYLIYLHKTVNICWIIEKAREFQKNVYFCFINYANTFDCVGHNKLWKVLKELGISDHLTCLLINLNAGQETTDPNMEQETGSKSGKEYVKAWHCHPIDLTSMQSTWCEILGWMIHKLESRLLGEISITSGMQMTPPLRQRVKKN